MAGIRDEKKKRTRRTILDVALRLFLTQGYDRTTTEQMAAEAGIGSGTIFNYFPSKADILIAVIAEDVHAERELDREREQERLGGGNRAPAEIVYDLVAARTGLFGRWSKELIREILAASLAAFKTRPAFVRGLFQIDAQFIQELKDVIERLKNDGLVARTLPAREASEVVYSVLLFEFMAYLFDDGPSYEDCLNRIRSKLEIVVSGWNR
jgi:AcrR family transcriptional regulator